MSVSLHTIGEFCPLQMTRGLCEAIFECETTPFAQEKKHVVCGSISSWRQRCVQIVYPTTFLKYAEKYGWHHPFMAHSCCANLRRDQKEPKHVVPKPHSLLLGNFFYLAQCVLSWCHVLHLRFAGVFLRKVLLGVWEVIVTCSQKPEDKSPATAEIHFSAGKIYFFFMFFLSSPPLLKETLAGCKSMWMLKNPPMHKHAQPYHKWKVCWSPNVLCLVIRM